MSANEETELIESVRELRTAFLGDLSGQKEGVIHRINRLHDDFYHPENPRESVHIRIKRLEDTENKRIGFMAALSIIGGGIGFGITSAVTWIAGKK